MSGINRAKALALTALALCSLTAMMASSAQATWLVGAGELVSGLRGIWTRGPHTPIKLVISARNIEVRCEAASAGSSSILGSTNKAVAEASISPLFWECETFALSSGALQSKCTPENQPITVGGRALVILHNSKNYVLFEPGLGQPFTTIEFPETCALTETSNVTGSLVAECGTLSFAAFKGEDCAVKRKEHLLRAAPASLFEADKLKFGANAATLEGIGAVELLTEEEWAGHV